MGARARTRAATAHSLSCAPPLMKPVPLPPAALRAPRTRPTPQHACCARWQPALAPRARRTHCAAGRPPWPLPFACPAPRAPTCWWARQRRTAKTRSPPCHPAPTAGATPPAGPASHPHAVASQPRNARLPPPTPPRPSPRPRRGGTPPGGAPPRAASPTPGPAPCASHRVAPHPPCVRRRAFWQTCTGPCSRRLPPAGVQPAALRCMGPMAAPWCFSRWDVFRERRSCLSVECSNSINSAAVRGRGGGGRNGGRDKSGARRGQELRREGGEDQGARRLSRQSPQATSASCSRARKCHSRTVHA